MEGTRRASEHVVMGVLTFLLGQRYWQIVKDCPRVPREEPQRRSHTRGRGQAHREELARGRADWRQEYRDQRHGKLWQDHGASVHAVPARVSYLVSQ